MANFLTRILTNFARLSLKNYQNTDKNQIYLNGVLTFIKSNYSTEPTLYEVVDEKKENNLVDEVIQRVNSQVSKSKEGRLFAIVHLAGKQIRITEGDVVIVEGNWPPECGSKISLNKVMLVGAADFTLIGRPIVQTDLVNIEATVIEKTLSHTKTHFRKKRRKQYMKIHFYRIPQTYLRINTIQINGELNNPPEVRGLEKAVF